MENGGHCSSASGTKIQNININKNRVILNRDALIERMRKLLVLSEQGIAGEAINAKKILDTLLVKYELQLSDLDNELRTKSFHRYSGPHQKRILVQLLASILPEEIKIYISSTNNEFYTFLTPAEDIFVRFATPIHYRALKTLHEDTTTAYIVANGIYYKSEKPQELTPEELAEREKIARLADLIPKTRIHQALPAPTPKTKAPKKRKQ